MELENFLNRGGKTCPLIGGFSSNANCLKDECAFWYGGVENGCCMWSQMATSLARIAVALEKEKIPPYHHIMK